jgi:hypothetical protein
MAVGAAEIGLGEPLTTARQTSRKRRRVASVTVEVELSGKAEE